MELLIHNQEAERGESWGSAPFLGPHSTGCSAHPLGGPSILSYVSPETLSWAHPEACFRDDFKSRQVDDED